MTPPAPRRLPLWRSPRWWSLLRRPRHLGLSNNGPVPGGRDALTCRTSGRSAVSGTARSVRRGDKVGEERRGPEEPSIAESQLSELQNMRVLVEEARLLARNLA